MMKFNTTIPAGLKFYYQRELALYNTAMQRGNLQQAWEHLENAHVLGQRYPYQHTQVHWKMLLFGFKIKSIKEIIGQLPRLIFGGVKSFVGHVPVGNTGGSNVPILKPMPIRKELEDILLQYQ
jgi:hypothetical protein